MSVPRAAATLAWQLAWRLDAGLFAASLMLLAVVWLGYPMVLALWARWHPYRGMAPATPSPWPRVSVIVSAHNEAAHIEARVRNLWAQEYPADRMEILIAEDGSSDDTVARVRAMLPEATAAEVAREGGRTRLRVLSAPERLGKAAAINRAAAQAWGEILVFSDANNEYTPSTLRHLVAPFADPSIGAVTGRKAVAAGEGLGGGENVYWRYEGWLTARESASGSTVAAFGEALALRRECFVPLPTQVMVNDDLYLALQALVQGWRVMAAPEARSWESGAATEGAEWERRQRMTVGRWAALASLWRVAGGNGGTGRAPWRRLGWANGAKVLFHEVLRATSGLWLGMALLSGLWLLEAPATALSPPILAGLRGLAWMQAGVYALVAGVGVGRQLGLRLGWAEAPYFFCLAQAASLGGWWRFLRRRQSPRWQRALRQRPEATASNVTGRHSSPMDNGRVLHGLFWASSSFVLGKLLVFGSVIVLARLLAPQAFGEVALALSTVTVLEVFGTLGLTSALIFEEQSVEAAASICFWITLAASLVETAVGWYFAPRLAFFFHEPELTAMLRAALACLVLMAVGNTHDTLLRRRLAFRAKMLPDVGMAAAKGTVGIVLAVMGWGAWSLIWGQVLGTGVSTVLLWWINPWRPRWSWNVAVARRMFGYAKHIYLLDGSSVVLTNLDSLTIGRMLSDALLGFYTLAFRIPEVLLLSVLNVITRVVFPAFSRLQSNRAALRASLLDTSRYTALLTLPMAAGMAVLAREVVLGIYGWHWGPAVPVLRILALYAGIRCLTHHFGDAYKAMGRPDILYPDDGSMVGITATQLNFGSPLGRHRWGGLGPGGDAGGDDAAASLSGGPFPRHAAIRSVALLRSGDRGDGGDECGTAVPASPVPRLDAAAGAGGDDWAGDGDLRGRAGATLPAYCGRRAGPAQAVGLVHQRRPRRNRRSGFGAYTGGGNPRLFGSSNITRAAGMISAYSISQLPGLARSTAATPHTIVVERREHLAAIERDWKRLFFHSRPANPFLSWEWQHAWLGTQPDGVRPLIVAEAFPDGSFAGLLALQRVRRHGLLQLEFLGQGSGADDLDCLLHPAAAPELAARLLATALHRQFWDLLRFEAARRDGGIAKALGMPPHRALAEPGEWLPYLSLPASFDDLLLAHSSNFRAEIRRRRRAFARLAPQAQVECLQSPAAVRTALEHLYRLHNLRRAQKRERGIFESAALRAFHARAATQLAANGSARIHLLRTPAAVIAALYGFQAGDRYLYFQSGFEPAWAAASPGTVLLSAVIEDCIGRGLRRFEFLRGEESYKGRWTTERRRGLNLLLARSPAGHGFLRLRAWAQRGRAAWRPHRSEPPS